MPQPKIKDPLIQDNHKASFQLPDSIEAEQGLLGALLANNAGVDRVADFLDPEHFSHPTHGRIYDAILKTVERGDIASPVRLKKYFENEVTLEPVGGTQYLVELVTERPLLNTPEDYARQIVECFQTRVLIQQCEDTRNRALNRSYDTSISDLIETHEQGLYNLAERGNVQKDAISFKSSIVTAINMIEKAYTGGGISSCVATGLSDLDRLLGGLHPTDLLILAGRPSMGKTALATNIAINAAVKHAKTKGEEGAVVGLFSLEMAHAQITTRILADLSGISSDSLRRGNIKSEEFLKLVEVTGQFSDLPLYIDDTPALTIGALRTRARRLKRKHNISLLIVDYLQMLEGSPSRRSGENRTQEVSEISRGLKNIAKELNIPVLALSQLSRAVEQREDKRPQLSDLRESGSIEQDADIVMFVYREEYYLSREEPSQMGSENNEKFAERYSRWEQTLMAAQNLTEVIVAKQRHGPIGTVKLYFNPAQTKFSDLA